MPHIVIGKPDPSEYLPYYSIYIDRIKEPDVLKVLSTQIDGTLAFLRAIPHAKADYRYAPGKWSVKEVIGHMIDSERVFAFRALWFARNESTRLPGFEQDDWFRVSPFDTITLDELITEFEQVRRSTVSFFQHLNKDAWMRHGFADNKEVSVRALAYIIAGHELHHVEGLKSKYGI
ncbi:MAG: DinB family protein [Ignavibacteriales bacterium]|nr:DinB family protein [Ignavibacteriales bacterium]MBI3787822.1 DinB family protein [Ignavibacteriales bacterium]